MASATATRIAKHNSTGTTSSSAVRRLPSSTSSLSSSTKAKSSNGNAPVPPELQPSFDLQACLEILKKLAPPISPELPSLKVVAKRKLGDLSKTTAVHRKGETNDRENVNDDTHKRQRRTSPNHTQDKDSLPSTSTKQLQPGSTTSAVQKRAFKLQRADSSSSINSITNVAVSSANLTSEHGTATGTGTGTSTGTSKLAQKRDDASNATENVTATASSDDQMSPLANLPSPTTASTTLKDPESIALGPTWSRARFKKVAATCREKGRALKHSGDRRMREYHPSSSNRHTPVLALLEQVDAVLLYAYAFWCEDQAAGSVRVRNSSISVPPNTTPVLGGPETASSPTWKAGCLAENWKSIFGLASFVKGRAEKLAANPPSSSSSSPRLAEEIPRAMELVVAWICMLEALILQHLTTHASRNLNSQAGKIVQKEKESASSSYGPSPQDNESSGAGATPSSTTSGDNHNPAAPSKAGPTSQPANVMSSEEFMHRYIKLQGDLEKIHSLWPNSQAVLLSNPDQSARRRLSPALSGHGSVSQSSSSRAFSDDDLLAKVLKKGSMAYDLEPVRPEDIVIPTLPSPSKDSDGVKSPEDLFKDEEEYFQFSWPVILHHQNAVAHSTSFGRALIFEISERLGIGYSPVSIE